MQQRKEPTWPRDQVAERLREAIGSGRYGPGAVLPTIRELAEEYGCAPRTAQEALRILARDGLITTRPRQGSIVAVADRSIDGPAARLRRSRSAGTLFRETEQVELLRVGRRIGHPDALAAFGLEEDAEIGVREYLVHGDNGNVITYGRSFIPPAIWDAVPELREPEPIADGIIGAIRRVLERDTVTVPARRQANSATEEEADYLGVDVDSPVLIEVTECQERADGAVLEWNLSIHPPGYWVGE